jgi:hypothetical protein
VTEISRAGSTSRSPGAGQAVAGRGIVRVELGGARVSLGRLLLFAAALVDQRLVRPALRDPVVQPDRHVEVGKRILLVIGGEVGESATIIGLRRIRGERDGGREVLEREGVLSLGLVNQPPIVVGARIGRIQLDGLLEIVERVLRPASLAVEIAASDIGRVIVGVELL